VSGIDDHDLAKGLEELAQKLLDHPEVGPVIRDAGTHKRIGREDIAKIWTLCDQSPAIAPFVKLQEYYDAHTMGQNRALFSNRIVALGIARRVAEGELRSVSDEAAKAQIRRNLVPYEVPVGNQPPRVDVRDRKAPFEIMYRVLDLLLKSPDLEEKYTHFVSEANSVDWNYRTSEYRGAEAPIQALGQEIINRFGWIAYPRFASIVDYLRSREIEFNCREEVKQALADLGQTDESQEKQNG
jgi:hypothetical protein